MGTALVILFLLAVSGLIAYSGDLLGRRMGKKRLSAFGLRPKHTAIVFTIGSGVLIAGFSLAAAFGASPGVRLALTQGEVLVLKNRALRQRLEGMHAEYSRTMGVLAARQEKIERLQADEKTLRSQNTSLQTQTGALKQRFASLSSSVRQLESSNQVLQQRNGALAVRQQALQADVSKLQSSNTHLVEEARQTREESRKLETRNGQLANSNRTLAGRNQALNHQVAGATAQLGLLQGQVSTLSHRAQQLAKENHIFSDREEIERRVVPANPPPEVIRGQIDSVLLTARHAAEERGAKGDPEHEEAAYLAAVSLPGVLRPIDRPEAIKELVAQQVLQMHGPAVLLAQAGQNCVKGEPVPVRILVFPNRLVLRKGEEIAAERIDGKESEDAVLEDVVAFLQKDVRERAEGLGMLPGPNGEVGEMRFGPLLEVMRKVRAVGGWAKVGAVARQDTWSGGQLHLDFYVVKDAGDVEKR